MIIENDFIEEEFTLSNIEELPLAGRTQFIKDSKFNLNELKNLIHPIETELDCTIDHQNLALLSTVKISLAVNNIMTKIKVENNLESFSTLTQNFKGKE